MWCHPLPRGSASLRSQHHPVATPLPCQGSNRFPPLLSSPWPPQAPVCKVLGDLEGAQRHGAHARVLNVICSLLLVAGVVLAIVAVTIT